MGERRKAYLTAVDIGRLWGEEQAKAAGEDPATAQPISPKTVLAMVWHATNEAGRYYGYPMPVLPAYPNPELPPAGQHAQWWPEEGKTMKDLERTLAHWWRHRPPSGSGKPRGPQPVYGDDIVAVVRERAAAGDSDSEIAGVLTERFGAPPAPSGRKRKRFVARIVEGIRLRHGIDAGVTVRRATS